MKKFHNNIKKKLITKYATECNKLIDLGCGKGGDMHKWINSNIKYVIGYDINKDYLKEAQERYENIKKQRNVDTNIIYKCVDLSENFIDLEDDKPDIITCNFAIHYFFKNEKTFNIFMNSIINNLKKEGYFLGTTFDGTSVLNTENTKFNQLFKIDKLNINNTLFGNKIKVYLKDSIIDNISYEYLILFGMFVSKMEENGFILVDSKLFSEFEEIKNLQDYERTFSSLNRYFVFKLINKVEKIDKIDKIDKKDNVDDINNLKLVHNFDKMKIKDLKEFCKNNNINNYSKLKKQELINHIYNNLKLNKN